MSEKPFEVQFIGIGAPRCATTWLFRCLIEHPRICGSRSKETAFWRTERPLDFYEEMFSHCPEGSIKGEFTPTYLYDFRSAKRIRDRFPSVKVIVCLRDPVARSYSHYWFSRMYKKTESCRSFEEAIRRKPEIYVDLSKYYKYLQLWFDCFPKHNIGVFFLEDIKVDPIVFVRNVYDFLGVYEAFNVPSCLAQENSIRETRSNRARVLLTTVMPKASLWLRDNGLQFMVDLVKCVGARDAISYVRDKLNTKPFEKPGLSPQTEQELRDILRTDVDKLEVLLGRDLSSWKFSA